MWTIKYCFYKYVSLNKYRVFAEIPSWDRKHSDWAIDQLDLYCQASLWDHMNSMLFVYEHILWIDDTLFTCLSKALQNIIRVHTISASSMLTRQSRDQNVNAGEEIFVWILTVNIIYTSSAADLSLHKIIRRYDIYRVV